MGERTGKGDEAEGERGGEGHGTIDLNGAPWVV